MRVLVAGILAGMVMAGAAVADTPAAAPTMVANSPTTTNYNASQGFPDHDGPFSAMLVVIPKSEMGEFEQAGGARHLDRVARAEPGADLALKILFTGMTGDWNGFGNVTYDLQVYKPDGSLYGASDYRNLDALHGKVGDGKAVFDNRGKVVLLTFDPTDPTGPYTIKVTVHDRAGARNVALQSVVELLPKPVAPGTAPLVAPVAPAADTDTPDADDKVAPTKKHRRHRRHH